MADAPTLSEQLLATLADGLSDNCMASVRKHAEAISSDIEGDIEYRLKEGLAPMLVEWVEEMAKRAVTSILEGSEDQMRRYLGCERGHWTGRSDSPYWRRENEADWHPVIHGKLFDHGAVTLRRQIVEAHRELIASERILDLEDQVKSLIAQVNKANAEREAMFQRARDYLPRPEPEVA